MLLSGRVVPKLLDAKQGDSTRFLVTGKFEGQCSRISRIKIEAEREGCSSIVASVPLSSDGTFKVTTDPLQESSTYQLRAVAVYNDALDGGRGEFPAPSADTTVIVPLGEFENMRCTCIPL